MATDNKVLDRRILEDVWNGRHVEVLDELLAPDFTFHDPQSPFPVKGAEAYKQFVRYYLGAFPDLHFTIEHQISDGESVMTRWSCTGTHKGDLRDIPATGRPIALTGITCARISGGRFVEGWSNWDALGMLQQLGVIPAQQPVEQAA
jgi:steroid delta-isomerase-like uncharacterized protein